MTRSTTVLKTDDKILIKPCSCFHWRQLLPVVKEIFPEYSESDISWYLRTYKQTTYVALQHNKIIGFYIYIYDKESDIIWLNNIGVKKENRSSGLGSILLQSFIQTAEQESCREIKLAVLKNNIPAVKLYEKLGFRKINEGSKKFVYSLQFKKVNSKAGNLITIRNLSYNFVSKIYLKFMYFIMVDCPNKFSGRWLGL